MRSKLQRMGAYTHRMRRSSTEIAIAAALTLAAVAFLAAAIGGGKHTTDSELGPVASEDAGIK